MLVCNNNALFQCFIDYLLSAINIDVELDKLVERHIMFRSAPHIHYCQSHLIPVVLGFFIVNITRIIQYSPPLESHICSKTVVDISGVFFPFFFLTDMHKDSATFENRKLLLMTHC